MCGPIIIMKGQETVSATIFSNNISVLMHSVFSFSNKKNVRGNCCADDELRDLRRQRARDRYANMPLDKKAELNARKREAYHRKKAEKQSGGVAPLTDTPQSAVLDVSGIACLTDTPQIASLQVAGNAGLINM